MNVNKKSTHLLSIAILAIISGCSHGNNNDSSSIFYGNHHTKFSELSSTEPSFLVQPFTENLRSLFDTNKATLRPKAKTQLNNLVSKLEKASKRDVLNAQNPLTIIGHTDSRASKKYNQKLAMRRAQSVANFLIENGVPKNFIQVSSKGELEPISTNKTRAGMQLNRRVVIHVTGDAINIVGN